MDGCADLRDLTDAAYAVFQEPSGRMVGASVIRRPLDKSLPVASTPVEILITTASIFDGREHPLVRSLRWYECAVGGLSLLLFVVGGALGALAGFLGVYANYPVLRGGLNLPLLVVASG